MSAPLDAVPADGATLAGARARAERFAAGHRQSAAWRFADAAFDPLTGASAEAVAAAAALLLADPGWARALLAPMLDALAADPWFEPPLRVQREAGRLGALLYEHRLLTITGALVEGGARGPVTRLVVPGRMSVVRYQRGNGRLLLWRIDPAAPAPERAPLRPAGAIALRDGLVRRIDGRTHAQLLTASQADLVVLTATIAADALPIAREYDRDSGALLRIATHDHQAARGQLLLSYLRQAGRREAGAAFAAATHAEAHFLRWAAMREWLALDARAALPRLRDMLNDAHGEVRAAAAATLPQVEQALACPV